MKNNPSGSSGIYSVCGTRCYIAPEVLQKKPYDTKADVFSYGVVLCEMINGTYPFETMDSRETHSLNELIVSGMRPRVPDECTPALKNLLESCWEDNPAARPSMEDILGILGDLEKESMAASQIFVDEELDDLPEEVKKVIQEERLRLSEIQSELYTLRSRFQLMQNELVIARKSLTNEVTTKQKIEKRVKVFFLYFNLTFLNSLCRLFLDSVIDGSKNLSLLRNRFQVLKQSNRYRHLVYDLLPVVQNVLDLHNHFQRSLSFLSKLS